ncbi:MAG: hypothetical protein HY754_12810 [Nitrospirae bacterium]|nr:hypothetical protein [Nitrospirota bacterium]
MKQYHVYIILVLLIAFTYGNSLQNSFVWDDHTVVIKNPKISPSLREIPSVFLTPLWKAAGVETRQVYYRPMVTLVGILNYKIWGLDPLGFHLTNILLHLITAIFVYRVGFLLFEIDANKELISLIAASIFVVYPVHNESVGRPAMGESLHGLFIILSLYFFLRERRYLSWITFSLALLSKELTFF